MVLDAKHTCEGLPVSSLSMIYWNIQDGYKNITAPPCVQLLTYLLEAFSQMALILRMAELQNIFTKQVLQETTQ